MQICLLVSIIDFIIINLVVLVHWSAVDGILPALVKLLILTARIVVQHWSLLDRGKLLSRVNTVMIVIFTWTSHLDHIHDILGVWVLLLAQVEHFEFLAYGRFVTSGLDVAERAQGLLRLTSLLRMGEALVLLDLSQSLLLFHAEFYVIQSFIRKSDQIRSDCQ